MKGLKFYTRRKCYSHLRYGEYFVLIAKGVTVLQGKIERLTDIDICSGLEMNVDKAIISTTDYDRSKKTEECEIFQTFGVLGAIFTSEIESWIMWQKQD